MLTLNKTDITHWVYLYGPDRNESTITPRLGRRTDRGGHIRSIRIIVQVTYMATSQ